MNLYIIAYLFIGLVVAVIERKRNRFKVPIILYLVLIISWPFYLLVGIEI